MNNPSCLFIIFSAALLQASAPMTCNAVSFGGRLWNDQNRNGLMDDGESAIANQTIFLMGGYEHDPPFTTPFATNMTDASGRYFFSGIKSNVYYIHIYTDYKYRVTFRNIGSDEYFDNDFYQASTFCGLPFAIFPHTEVVPGDTNINAGLFALVPDMAVSVKINDMPADHPVYVTNGTPVTIEYTVTNNGETCLSYMDFFDDFNPDGLSLHQCPMVLFPNQSFSFSNSITVFHSMTNSEFLSAFPVEACTCSFHGSDPPLWAHQTILIVATNDTPETIDDDNQPIVLNAMVNNEALVVFESSTSSIYSVWWSTNLLDDSQEWNQIPSEQIGTGAALNFPINNDAPLLFYRIGVREP